MKQERLVFHIDVNSAFLSWESVYRLSINPGCVDLRTIPSAVGGDAKTRHGIVLAKSSAAKKYGVTTGEPLVQALRKCPSLTVVPSRFEIYMEYSEKLMELLGDYSPDMEQFSIDEAFLDMTETIHLFGEPVKVANQLREDIKASLGFTVNIGIAPNKLLAKMASDFQKPDLCHTLYYNEIPQKMWPLPVGELYFVGGAAQKKLESIGIHTIGQLAKCDVGFLKSRLGSQYSELIHQYANGYDEDPVGEKEPVHKGYGNSVTLPFDVSDYDTAFQILLSLSETVGARLRASHVLCNCICIELKDWEFHTQSHQLTLDSPTDSTFVLYQNACRLFKELWNLAPIRLIGLRASRLSDDNYRQLSLFDSMQSEKMKNLEKAVDLIRGKYGVDSIKRASFLKEDAVVDHASGKTKHLKRGL